MKLDNLRLAKSGLTDNIYIGTPSKDGTTWLNKKDVTNDFLKCVLDRWNGYEEDISSSCGKKFTISVKEVTDEKVE